MQLYSAFVLGLLSMSLVSARVLVDKRRYCGAQLMDVLQVLCMGRYHYPNEKTNDLRRKMRQTKRRAIITEECCQNACDLKTLLSYCHHDNDQNNIEERRPQAMKPKSNSLNRGENVKQRDESSEATFSEKDDEPNKKQNPTEDTTYHKHSVGTYEFQGLNEGKFKWKWNLDYYNNIQENMY